MAAIHRTFIAVHLQRQPSESCILILLHDWICTPRIPIREIGAAAAFLSLPDAGCGIRV
jgi:hypothetical protein